LSQEVTDWQNEVARLVASSAVIIILINESAFIQSAPSRMTQRSINDAHTHGTEVVAVFTGPLRSKSSFRRAAAIFKTRPHIVSDDEPQALRDIQERVEEALAN